MSAQGLSIVPLILGLIAVACVLAGIYLIATSRRSVGSGPRCGHCQYNLTGAPSNRCPECGRLFIEVGVITSPVTSLRKRRRIGIVLIVLPLVPATIGFVTTMFYRERAARQAAAAEKAKAAKIYKFQQDMLSSVRAALQAETQALQMAQQAQAEAAAQSQPTTAPASQPRP